MQWIMATWASRFTASSNCKISSAYLTSLFPEVKSPLPFHISPWAWTTMKAYLESVYILTFFPRESTKALVSSAFYAEVPGTKAWASLMSVVTTMYPAHRWLLSMKLLPSLHSSQYGVASSWSSRSGLLEYTKSMISKESCWRAESPSISGSRVARLRVVVVCKVTFGLSSRMTWYFPMHPSVRQYPPFSSNWVRTWYGPNTVVGYSKVNSSDSCKMS